MDIVWHKIVESTNTEASKALPNLANLSVTAAFCQSGGRGQGDHSWHSAEGQNLTFTMAVKFAEMGLEVPARDVRCIIEAVTAGIRHYLSSEGIETRIKWPNDIWVGDRKICGILIENTVNHGCVETSLVGIGLNVNETSFPEDLPNPTSMAALTGRKYDVKKELETLASHLEQCILMLCETGGREKLAREFDENVFRLSA